MSSESRSEMRRQQTVSVGNWIGTLFLMAIPVVNLIMAIVWAITCKVPSKRNFALAWIILAVIFVVASVVVVAFFGEHIINYLMSIDFTAMRAVMVG